MGMPEISRFYGIVIRMFAEPGARHRRPHFHAIYQDMATTYTALFTECGDYVKAGG